MSKILLVDFGASRIKTMLFDCGQSVVIDQEECASPSIKSHSAIQNRFEIPVEDYWMALMETVGKIILRHPEINIWKMWICAEMHGFVVTTVDGHAITPYISWKDQRADFDCIEGVSTFEKINSELDSFQSITGMNLKSGLPILTLASGLTTGSIEELIHLGRENKVRILSLVDWILFRGGESAPKANFTLAAGLGLYDLNDRALSSKILKSKYLNLINIVSMDIQSDITKPLGKIRIYDSEITLFGGIGDFQAAVLGSGLDHKYDGIINMGTGSQVAVRKHRMTPTPSDQETRIMPDCSYLNVITHIPCGRALNVIGSFLDSFALISGGRAIFWKTFSSLSPDNVIRSKLLSNLALFESAWSNIIKSKMNGYIGIEEDASSVSDVFGGIAKSWLLQYSNALDRLDPSNLNKEIVVCGGVAHKCKFVLPVLEHIMPQRQFYLAELKTGEETLDGLLRLATNN